MADFSPVTASNGPALKNVPAVEAILARYYLDPEFHIGVAYDHADGAPYLFVYGHVWPETWKLPEGVECDDFDPYTSDLYEEGADGFVQLLKEIAPFLKEPLVVQAIGSIKCRFPLSASEWRIRPGAVQVEVNEFRFCEPEVFRTECARTEVA